MFSLFIILIIRITLKIIIMCRHNLIPTFKPVSTYKYIFPITLRISLAFYDYKQTKATTTFCVKDK